MGRFFFPKCILNTVFKKTLATRQYSLSENIVYILYLKCSFDSKYVSNTRKTWENVINIIQIDVKYNSNF